jgi:hypothetical protein
LQPCNSIESYFLKKLLILTFSLVQFFAQAQDFYSLKGYVSSIENEPLIGVNIRVFDSQTGTQTNEKGQYELRLEQGLHRISFSYLVYETQTIEVVFDQNKVQNVFLNPDQNVLNEIVVKVKK